MLEGLPYVAILLLLLLLLLVLFLILLHANRQRIASFFPTAHRFVFVASDRHASLRLVAEAIAVRDTRALVRSRSSVACVRAGDYAGNLTNWRENTRLRCPTTGLRCYSPATLPTGNAGRNRHEPASKVSAPADIQGGDAVSDGKPFGRSDALSVRSFIFLFLLCASRSTPVALGPPAGWPKAVVPILSLLSLVSRQPSIEW